VAVAGELLERARAEAALVLEAAEKEADTLIAEAISLIQQACGETEDGGTAASAQRSVADEEHRGLREAEVEAARGLAAAVEKAETWLEEAAEDAGLMMAEAEQRRDRLLAEVSAIESWVRSSIVEQKRLASHAEKLASLAPGAAAGEGGRLPDAGAGSAAAEAGPEVAESRGVGLEVRAGHAGSASGEELEPGVASRRPESGYWVAAEVAGLTALTHKHLPRAEEILAQATSEASEDRRAARAEVARIADIAREGLRLVEEQAVAAREGRWCQGRW